MANPYFQFKQFRIEQGNCGMKVTTEGCILGALASKINSKSKRVLDIGTGTGLLALMISQANQNASIDAIEIDKEAFDQAQLNFGNSPWHNRLTAYHIQLNNFEPDHQYDHIVCNPPFFKNNQRGENRQKNKAIHNDHLTFDDLVNGVSKLLAPEGIATILYPSYEMQIFSTKMNDADFQETYNRTVFDKADKPVFRQIKSFSVLKSKPIVRQKLVIKNNDESYTQEFADLLSPYYLHL